MAMKNVHIEHKMIRIGLVNDLSTLVKGFTMPNSDNQNTSLHFNYLSFS